MSNPLVHYNGKLHVVLRETDDWGIKVLDLGAPPARLSAPDRKNRAPIRTNIDPIEVRTCPTPAAILNNGPDTGDNWSALTRRSLARLAATFLVAEDPQRRLDAREVVTLAHQVSLVRHILENPDRRRVLIADEVGLGKTIEAGLILQELLQANSSLRVLYLAPARLVSNVGKEFQRLNLGFREWKTQDGDARLETDSRIIASIHRAVHPNHFDRLIRLPRWDVIVVDECHHLSDWADGGGDPVRKYRLVRDLIADQARDAYLLLLSGTPHQAHQARFENLLRLLQTRDEQLNDVRGRVIYRTKDDVRDWDGNPLFPRRQVNPPILIELSTAHQDWLTNIYNYFRPRTPHSDDIRRRAAGWKCAQALQWATSSPNAGLGYLVRQALRAGGVLENATLRAAIAELRPYRSGHPDEPVETLYERLCREIRRQIDDDDLEDIEEVGDATGEWQADVQLEQLIQEGVSLVRSSNQEKWQRLWNEVIQPAGNEKMVLFAQPIETVMALATWLRHQTGRSPAIIIGGQSEAERERQVDLFRNPDGAQFLISSRAGGEGINLQFARRLVHLDVPWNPMEMEQRAGRVHRFGSRQTVLIDTLIVRDSRESHAWTVARERLDRIAHSLVAPERFDTVFSRVMCLIPPDELQTVLIDSGSPRLQDPEIRQISDLVDSGFQSWQQFHDQFAANQQSIRDQNPGLARWQHLRDFLVSHGDAEPVTGVVRNRFELQDSQVTPRQESADVIRLSDQSLRFVGDFEGNLFDSTQDAKIEALGLNIPQVAKLLSDCASPQQPSGAAFLKWNEDGRELRNSLGNEVILLGFTRQKFFMDSSGGIKESGLDQILYALTSAGSRRLTDEERAMVFSLEKKTAVRVKPIDSPLIRTVAATEKELTEKLRRPSEIEIRAGLRYAIWPILAAHISP